MDPPPSFASARVVTHITSVSCACGGGARRTQSVKTTKVAFSRRNAEDYEHAAAITLTADTSM
jgi:hypothetical protein